MIEIKEDSLSVKAGRNTFLAVFLFIFAILIPFVILNSAKAFQTQDNLMIFTFYSATIALPFIYLLISDFTQSLRKKSWTSIFNSYGHNPSDGWFSILFGKEEPKTFKTFSKSVFLMTWFSILFALIISFAYVANPTGSQYYQAPPSAFDKIPVSNQLGQIYLAIGGGFTEELVFEASMLGILFGVSLWLSKGNKGLFMLYEILGIILTLATVLIYHSARYGTNEQALIGVGALFFLTIMVTKLTGSIIFALIFHPTLNAFWKAKLLFATNENVLLLMLGTIIAIIIISTIIYVIRQLSRKEALVNEATI